MISVQTWHSRVRALRDSRRHLAWYPTTPDIHPVHSLAQPVNVPTIDAGGYMHTLVQTVRDAKLALLKSLEKAQELDDPPTLDPKNSRAVRVYVAMRFSDRQGACVEVI